jgi:two-component system OmpR family response regulator
MRILLIEDDAALGALLRRRLGAENMIVDWVSRVEEARSACRDFAYDVVILDRGLPDGDGLDLLAALRASPGKPRILVLTARGATHDRISGLNAGADDYLGKPFDPDELAARCRALGRRFPPTADEVITVANITFNQRMRSVSVAGQTVTLSRRELLILECLIRSKGRVVPRERLLEQVYGFDDEIESNGLESNMSRLRKTLREAGGQAEIRVVRGIGYFIGTAPPGGSQ